jgi:adenosine deaminase
MKRHAPLLKAAREAGLGITVHTGEVGKLKELRYVVREIKPDRIGHGIACVKDKKLMQDIVKNNITLEICPTSNLRNSAVKNIGEIRTIIKTFLKNKIKFTINTDGPEMYQSNICQEHELLKKHGIMTQKEIDQTVSWAFEASFVK